VVGQAAVNHHQLPHTAGNLWCNTGGGGGARGGAWCVCEGGWRGETDLHAQLCQTTRAHASSCRLSEALDPPPHTAHNSAKQHSHLRVWPLLFAPVHPGCTQPGPAAALVLQHTPWHHHTAAAAAAGWPLHTPAPSPRPAAAAGCSCPMRPASPAAWLLLGLT
jgi:hypothetical protein